MATRFTGTSTGKTYEVGGTYKGSGGATYTAMADGSFFNNDTQRFSVGSSQSPHVTWSTDERETPLPRTLVTDEGRTIHTNYPSAPATGSGPGSGHVSPGGAVPTTGGVGVPGSLAIRTRAAGGLTFNPGNAPWPKPENPPEVSYHGHSGLIPNYGPSAKNPGREFPMGPFTWESNPYWPTAQAIEDEMGEPEITNPMAVGVMLMKSVSDIRWNVDRAKNHIGREIANEVVQWSGPDNSGFQSRIDAGHGPRITPDQPWGR